jgi:A/G-specific adenine glycosylase
MSGGGGGATFTLYYTPARTMTLRPRPAVARALLRWYDRAKRDLPWRREPTAYKTLVSELMLQQTAVATVEPYFERFVRQLPTLQALASASDEQVTALWSGLGYYARARNLRRAAAVAVAEHGGELPRSEAALLALPGVGPYTAAAVASIAFGARTFALDGNAARVMARLHGVREPIDRPATRRQLAGYGLDDIPARRAGDFNQAVMELGALICTPRRPRCQACPLRDGCVACQAGLAGLLPTRTVRRQRPLARVVCVCVTDGACVLMVKRRAGLLAGTWALPEVESTGSLEAPASVARKLAARAGARGASLEYRGAVRHVFTHRDLTAQVFRVEVAGRPRPAADRRWVVPEDLGRLGVSSFARKTIALGAGPRKQDSAGVAP